MEVTLLILKITLMQICYIFVPIFLFGYILGILRHYSINYLYKVFGKKIIYITSIIGTPIHEFGHYIMCIIFFHKVDEVKLFNFSNKSDVLGYVSHRYNKKNIYQRIGNFFISIGPFFSGILTIILLMYFLIQDTFFKIVNNYQSTFLNENYNSFLELKNYSDMFFTIYNSIILEDKKFIAIFVFLLVCISLHMSLSSNDIKGLKDGFPFLILIMIVLNLIFYFLEYKMYFNYFKIINIYEINIFLISIVPIILIYIISIFLYKLSK